jgi:hypothetical protein
MGETIKKFALTFATALVAIYLVHNIPFLRKIFNL